MRWAIFGKADNEPFGTYGTKKEALEALNELPNPEQFEVGKW